MTESSALAVALGLIIGLAVGFVIGSRWESDYDKCIRLTAPMLGTTEEAKVLAAIKCARGWR